MDKPAPYYQDGWTTIYHGDFHEIMPELPKVDLVLTDPPYGCSATSGWGGTYDSFSIHGDNSTELRDWLLGYINETPCVMFGSPRVRRPEGVTVLIWSKGEHTGMGNLDFPWKPDYEEIYVRGHGFSGPRTSSILSFNARTDSGRFHPTEKPVALITEILKKSPPGTILDPFMGSGTTLVAAKRLGRKAIGIEIEERYCKIAVERLRQYTLPFDPGSADEFQKGRAEIAQGAMFEDEK